jgi:uncharacterized protein DUF4157
VEADPAIRPPRLSSGPFARAAARLLRADAFVLGRRIFLSREAAAEISSGSERGASILAHELEHVRQYARLGTARFLARYASDYFRARLSGASHAEAYAAIGLEREAFRAAARPARNPAGPDAPRA